MELNYKERMKEIRTYDLTNQKTLAQIMGIEVNTYSQYELQYNIIPLKHLIVFCDYFNVSIDYFFGLTEIQNYKNSEKLDKEGIIKNVKIRLKEFRKDFNVTQEQLEIMTKLDRTTIAKYENGTRLISTSFLYAICSEYKISADYLLGRTDYHKNLD